MYTQVQNSDLHTSPKPRCTNSKLRCTKEGKSKIKLCKHKSKANVYTQVEGPNHTRERQTETEGENQRETERDGERRRETQRERER